MVFKPVFRTEEKTIQVRRVNEYLPESGGAVPFPIDYHTLSSYTSFPRLAVNEVLMESSTKNIFVHRND